MVILILLVWSTKQHQTGLKVNPTIFGYLFILASADSSVEISYTNSGQNNIGINICWRHQSLNFPCRRQQSILRRPYCNVLDVSFAWLMSFKDSSNQRPKLFTGSSDTVGILWPSTIKFIFWFTFPFLSDIFSLPATVRLRAFSYIWDSYLGKLVFTFLECHPLSWESPLLSGESSRLS